MKLNNGTSLENDLIQTIRGYSGYQKAKSREKSDKKLRQYFTSEIKKIEKSFLRVSDRINKQGNISITSTIDKLIVQLKDITDSFDKPSYNKSTFFLHRHLNMKILSQLYQYETLLKYYISILSDEVNEFKKVEEITETTEFLNHIFNVIDSLNQIIIEREYLLVGENL